MSDSLWPMNCSTPGLPVHHQLPELTQTHVHWFGDAIQPSHHLPSPSPAFNRSQHQGLFKWVSSSHQVAKILEFQLQHQSLNQSNEYSGLISFRMDWFDLLAVQGTLKNILQHHSSKASILRHSAFFVVQLSHLYMTTGKSIALTMWTFVSKIMSLLLNTLSRCVVAFLPTSKYLLISCKLVDLEALLDLYLSLGATSLVVLHVFSSYKGFSCTPHILIYCVFINIVFKKIFKFSFSPVSLFLNFLNSDLCCSFRASTIF